MKRELRKNWQLGFLGIFSLFGLRYFLTGEWFHLIWFAWIIWFIHFIPIKKK